LIIIPVATYAYFARDIGDKERLMNRNNTGVVLLDQSGESFYSFGRAEHRDLVPLSDIADETKQALIASEDRNFYEHRGFSVTGFLRAVYGTVTSQEAYGGGSTLTQQLAKNTLLSSERSFLRKYQELAVSIAIERRYSKDEILEMYLNSIHYGEGTFGIKDAAEVYFGKQPSELNLAESAMLVGVLPAPGAYSPISGDPELARQRQTTVLERMVKNGYITEAEKAAALDFELKYADKASNRNGEAVHFAEMVLSELYDRYGEERVIRSGFQVKTTLNLKLQRAANEAVKSQIGYINQQGGSNASAVVIDPTSGQIRALVGSADWTNEEFGMVNMATTPRQPGSSFKPVYYAEALANGVITPASIYRDEPINIDGYQPQNADRRFRGSISIRRALAQSLNIPSVKVMQELGVKQAIEATERMGVTTLDDSADYGLSFALGSAEVPLTEMTNIYAAFANRGQQFDLSVIDSIDDKFGRTIFDASSTSRTVLSPQGAFLISSILSDQQARAPVFGSSLTVPGRQAAVKTGTTDDRRDAWTIGYTPELAVGVWVGNNDNRTMLSGGSDMAGPIWRSIMSTDFAGDGSKGFSMPSGIVEVTVCYANGGRANRAGAGTYKEYFLASAQPTETRNVPDPAEEERKRREREAEEKRQQEEREQEEEQTGEDQPEDGEDDSTPPSDEGDTPPVNPPEPGPGGGSGRGPINGPQGR